MSRDRPKEGKGKQEKEHPAALATVSEASSPSWDQLQLLSTNPRLNQHSTSVQHLNETFVFLMSPLNSMSHNTMIHCHVHMCLHV